MDPCWYKVKVVPVLTANVCGRLKGIASGILDLNTTSPVFVWELVIAFHMGQYSSVHEAVSGQLFGKL